MRTHTHTHTHTHTYTHTHTLLYSPEGAHAPEGQSPDHGVPVLAVLLQGVHRQQRQLRVGLCIVTEVEVHQLLLDWVLRCPGLDRRGEGRGGEGRGGEGRGGEGRGGRGGEGRGGEGRGGEGRGT